MSRARVFAKEPIMKRIAILAVLASSSALATGCSSEKSCGELDCDNEQGPGGGNGGEGGSGGGGGGQQPGVTCSDAAQERLGLGGSSLKLTRQEGVGGADRRRTKPYEVLSGEIARVVGSTPASMAALGATFGEPPARWFVEPKPSAVALSSALDVTFESCLKYTETDAAFGTAPEPSTASAACTDMARKFWSRVVAPADVQGCVDVATVDSVNETYASGANGSPLTTATTPRRRWAYACASLLTSTQFLAY